MTLNTPANSTTGTTPATANTREGGANTAKPTTENEGLHGTPDGEDELNEDTSDATGTEERDSELSSPDQAKEDRGSDAGL